jgi:hypothetical protein
MSDFETVDHEDAEAVHEPDFSVAGIPLETWLGRVLEEATRIAADKAITLPEVSHLVALVRDPDTPYQPWFNNQRRMLDLYKHDEYPQLPGRLRMHTRTFLEPQTNQDVRAVLVTYEPKARTAQVSDG